MWRHKYERSQVRHYSNNLCQRIHPHPLVFIVREKKNKSRIITKRISSPLMLIYDILYNVVPNWKKIKFQVVYTVEPVLTHTPRWMARAMGYWGLWVMRGHFWCKITIWFPKKVWVMRGYGLRQVWVKTGSTVFQLITWVCSTRRKNGTNGYTTCKKKGHNKHIYAAT